MDCEEFLKASFPSDVYTNERMLLYSLSLANHVPSIESLKPGVLEVIEGSSNESKKWFGKSISLSLALNSEVTWTNWI